MKKPIYLLLLVFMSGLMFSLSSCDRNEDEVPETTPTPTPAPPPAQATPPSNPTPTPTDANGVLVAVKSISSVTVPIVGPQKIETGIPVALFFDTPNTYLDAGVVSCNSINLTKQTNNSYVYTVDATTPTGVSYSSGVTWSVEGNTSTGVPAINHSPTIPFPVLDSIAGNISKVTKANGVTIAATNTITGADSVIFGVYAPNGGVVQVTKSGNISSHTFSSADLNGLSTGNGYIQIAAYSIGDKTVGGKKYYFIKEAVFTKMVAIE